MYIPEEPKFEAKSHGSFDYLRSLHDLSITVSVSAMQARKYKTPGFLDDYYNATLEYFNNARAATLGDTQINDIQKKLDKVKEMLKWLRLTQDQRLVILFPQPKVDYSYKKDEVFIDKPKPRLPLEYTTNYLGSACLSILESAFIKIKTDMQKKYKILLRIGEAQDEDNLADINARYRRKRLGK